MPPKIAAFFLLLILSCDPSVSLPDIGLSDATSNTRCPRQIYSGLACDFRELICPLPTATCRCVSDQWVCRANGS